MHGGTNKTITVTNFVNKHNCEKTIEYSGSKNKLENELNNIMLTTMYVTLRYGDKEYNSSNIDELVNAINESSDLTIEIICIATDNPIYNFLLTQLILINI